LSFHDRRKSGNGLELKDNLAVDDWRIFITVKILLTLLRSGKVKVGEKTPDTFAFIIKRRRLFGVRTVCLNAAIPRSSLPRKRFRPDHLTHSKIENQFYGRFIEGKYITFEFSGQAGPRML
jgi:hypothetical protein